MSSWHAVIRVAEKAALARLKTNAAGASAELAALDLASLESIREFARRELAEATSTSCARQQRRCDGTAKEA